MNYKRIVIALIFVFLGIITTSLFWKQPILLSLGLIVLAIIKQRFAAIKRWLLCFVVVGVLGTTTESLIMFLGNKPWIYSRPDIFNFPIWLIPLWGLAGTIFVSLYEGLLKDS